MPEIIEVNEIMQPEVKTTVSLIDGAPILPPEAEEAKLALAEAAQTSEKPTKPKQIIIQATGTIVDYSMKKSKLTIEGLNLKAGMFSDIAAMVIAKADVIFEITEIRDNSEAEEKKDVPEQKELFSEPKPEDSNSEGAKEVEDAEEVEKEEEAEEEN